MALLLWSVCFLFNRVDSCFVIADGKHTTPVYFCPTAVVANQKHSSFLTRWFLIAGRLQSLFTRTTKCLLLLPQTSKRRQSWVDQISIHLLLQSSSILHFIHHLLCPLPPSSIFAVVLFESSWPQYQCTQCLYTLADMHMNTVSTHPACWHRLAAGLQPSHMVTMTSVILVAELWRCYEGWRLVRFPQGCLGEGGVRIWFSFPPPPHLQPRHTADQVENGHRHALRNLQRICNCIFNPAQKSLAIVRYSRLLNFLVATQCTYSMFCFTSSC
jgi:hypothetical protein